MFAQLFGAAKRAISRTPSYQGLSNETQEEVPISDPTPIDTVTMVTTRRGTETPGMATTPASSTKKTIGKRELEALETPTQVKRQRKTTVELKRNLRSTPRKGEAASAESTQEHVDETASDTIETTKQPENLSELTSRRQSSSKAVVEPSSPAKEDAHAQENAFHTPEPASSEAAFVTPFTSKKALEGSPTPKATKTTTPVSTKKTRGRPKKAQKAQKDDTPEEAPSSIQGSSVASPTIAPAKAHVRFGSEELTMNAKGHARYDVPAPAPAPTPAAVEDDDDSADDSDEAPEMVTTSAAASKAAAAQADTSRALLAQQEAERKKREAREARIVEEQAAKRARDTIKAQKAAARAAKAARLSSVVEVDEDAATPMEIDRTALPSFLPDSLLANLGDVRPPTPPPEARGKTDEELRREKLNHHIKFLEQSSKVPKDKRVGRHHIAVLGQQNRVLPPKVSKATRGVREGWLKARQGQQANGKPRIGKTARTKFGSGGFLRGED